MKFFASNLLADAFGRQFGALDPREIECKLVAPMECLIDLYLLLVLLTLYLCCAVFTNNLSYVILRELDLVRHPNLSLRHLA